jgi:Rieske Fe-S protein
MQRREFLEGVGTLTTLACYTCLLGCEEPKTDQPAKGVSVGQAADFAQGVTELAMFRIAVIKYGSELRVVSLVCPHQSCIVKSVVGGGYQCPCHGSEFNAKGEPQSGPAKEPLSWIATEITSQGELLIFPQRRVEASFAVRL